ncbi:2-haloacid dehalogenase [Paracoccus isoporae]|uniref:2-haloacid dehalogenase n=1 Tax=Paracoccus isoporae TaxID=591205 RepID=A0A1G6U417_9RHOB|nr:HAD family phosphatase [Paracoccus isoporae]SDD35337.1 2-haloacid dehalogenase [Paracoccus isoporae]
MKAVVFDIGNVLVRWDPVAAFEDDLGGRQQAEAFLRRIDFDARNLRADAGSSFADLAQELDDAGDHALLAAYPARFGRTIAETIDGSWALLDRLAGAGLEIHAITNWSAETWPEGAAVHPRLGTAFGTVIVSGELGMVKPDPAIFEFFCQHTGLAPQDCLFIDDKEENCAAAMRVGMQAEIFTAPDALEAALQRRGLL